MSNQVELDLQCVPSADVSSQNMSDGYRRFTRVCTRLNVRLAAILATAALSAACSVSLPIFAAFSPEPKQAELTTGSLPARHSAPSSASAFTLQSATGKPALADHLGPEDLRRANGALALALDPQGNGQPVTWENAESRSSGKFTPVGWPFLKDHEVCRAFQTSVITVTDRQTLRGVACRPSGGEWSISEMKAAKQG